MCWNQALIGHSFSRACHPEICIYPLANHQVRDLKYIPAKLECFELRYQDFLPESDHQMSTWSVRCLSAYSWWPGTYSKWFMITCGKAFFFFKKKKVHACLSLPPIQHELPTCPYLLLQRGCSSWAHPRQVGTRPLNATVNPKHCVSASLWYSLPHKHIPTPFCSLPLNAVNNPY